MLWCRGSTHVLMPHLCASRLNRSWLTDVPNGKHFVKWCIVAEIPVPLRWISPLSGGYKWSHQSRFRLNGFVWFWGSANLTAWCRVILFPSVFEKISVDILDRVSFCNISLLWVMQEEAHKLIQAHKLWETRNTALTDYDVPSPAFSS